MKGEMKHGRLFEDLGKRITETAGAVTKKTEEVVETQKIKARSEWKNEIKKEICSILESWFMTVSRKGK